MSDLSKKVVFIVFALAIIANIYSQDKDNPWVIGFGVNAVDFYPTNINGMVSKEGEPTKWFDQFFNLNEHYNYISAPSKLSLTRYINESFNVEVALSINKLTVFGSTTLTESVPYFAGDLNVNYDLNMLVGDTGFFDPYVFVGGGYNVKNGDAENNIVFDNYASFNSGLGAKFWIYKGLGFRIQSSLKYFFNDGSYRHFQHSASILYKFGGYDEDGDGVYDKDDKCPEISGLAEFNGCPDSDNDGIQDADDACPDVFGVEALKGCPDSDGDGITDKQDFCPFKKGTLKNNGCPDTDGDGIIDKQDVCPTTPGVFSNKGCPEDDSDGDGVIDRYDKCKFEPGLKSNDGCPKVEVSLEMQLTDLASSILFVSGYDVFYPQGEIQLNRIAKLMIEHSESHFEIQGYTDNIGSPEDNYELSIKRVNAVLDYLVSKGVNPSGLSVKGFGESKPIATNNTPEGRAQNRRVIIKILE